MSNVIEEFVAFLGWEVDTQELEKFQRDVDGLEKIIKGVVGAVTVASAAVTGFLVIENQATARTVALAKAYGVTADFLEAMGGAVKDLGFDVENVGDLIEEMNNKIGESKGLNKPLGAVADATKILGLEWKDLKDQDPAGQLIDILDAAVKLEDQQRAVAAVDILAGGEANRIVGYLKSQDKSLRDIIARQYELNQLSDEGRDGAVAWQGALGELSTVAGSLSQQLAGLIGEGLAPLITQVVDWVLQNKELVKVELAKWVDDVVSAMKTLFQIGKWAIDRITGLVEVFGGLENVLTIAALLFSTFITQKTLGAISSGIALTGDLLKNMTRVQAMSNLKAVWDFASIGIALLLLEDLYQFFTGGDSITGRMSAAWTVMFDDLADRVFAFVSEMTGIPVGDLMTMWVNAITEPLQSLERMFEVGLRKIEELFGVDVASWAQTVAYWLGVPFYLMGKVVEATYNFIVGLFMGDLGQRFDKWTTDVVSYFERMASPILGVFGSIKTGIINTFESVVRAINSAIDKLPGPLRSIIKGGLSIAGDLMPAVDRFVHNATLKPEEGYEFAARKAVIEEYGFEAATIGAAKPQISSSPGRLTNDGTTQVLTVNNAPVMTIVQQPGEDGSALSRRIVDAIEETGANASRNLASGIEY